MTSQLAPPSTKQSQASGVGDFNAISFLVQQALNKCNHVGLVKVIACTNQGGLSAVGFVDVQPLVNQLDGQNKAVPHGVIYGLPYVRLQGGINAIILDPEPNDLGVAVYSDRDISAVKSTKDQANPGSKRRFDWADGIYIFGLLNGVPLQYVQFTPEGINVVSPTAIKLLAPLITLQGAVVIDGVVTGGTDVGNKIQLQSPLESTSTIKALEVTWGTTPTAGSTHIHSDSGGSGDGGAPVPGS